jgi:hypothetical protein
MNNRQRISALCAGRWWLGHRELTDAGAEDDRSSQLLHSLIVKTEGTRFTPPSHLLNARRLLHPH